MSVSVEHISSAEYRAREDPRRTDLIDGMVVVNAPSAEHQFVCAELHAALRGWTRASGFGYASWPLDLELEEGQTYAPDVLWFAQPIPMDAVRAPRVPELVIEVRSPSTWAHDIGRKREVYERHGVQELWLADTASHSVLVYARPAPGVAFDAGRELTADDRLTSPLLPGFALAVAEVFPPAD